MKVREIMTTNPACCTSDSSLQEVARMMNDHDCGCIPVVESHFSMRPIGTITDRDITIRTFATGQNPLEMKASDIMTTDIVTVSPGMSVEECCNVMENNQIRRVLVVDENGKCTGIVAQADVAQYVTNPRQAAELVREISEPAGSHQTGSHNTEGRYTGRSMSRKNKRSSYSGKSSFSFSSLLPLLAGVGTGAALSYFMNSGSGERSRQASVSHKNFERETQFPATVSRPVTGTTYDVPDVHDETLRDLSNTTSDMSAENRGSISGRVTTSSDLEDDFNTDRGIAHGTGNR